MSLLEQYISEVEDIKKAGRDNRVKVTNKMIAAGLGIKEETFSRLLSNEKITEKHLTSLKRARTEILGEQTNPIIEMLIAEVAALKSVAFGGETSTHIAELHENVKKFAKRG